MSEGDIIKSESDTSVIKDKKPIDKKIVLTTNQKITRWCVIFIFAVIMIGLIYTLIYNLTKPSADYEGFKSAMRVYLTANDDIVDIEIEDNDMFNVIVKDTWFNSSEIAKLRFCNDVHKAIFVYADKYHLIDGDNENVYLYFYDTTGINVAKHNFGDFEILY